MSDFFQNGVISTLHRLTERPLEDLEKELVEISKVNPMALLLPSLFSELEGEALANIVDELQGVPYLSQIIIGLDRATKEEFQHAKKYFAKLGQHHRILWNDGPRLKAIDERLQKEGLAPKEMGKGRNVWYCMGYFLASKKAKTIALHDCDILTYKRELPARLLYPVANPTFGYKFCKGYYYRAANGKLNGRVSRLLVTPLVRALKKVLGPNDYLEYIDSFRYPLAGEFCMQDDVVRSIRIPSDWGLEIGVLSEVNRDYANNKLCQVDIADAYDHKHQEVSLDDREKGLSKMSMDISKSFFRKLATNGQVFSPEIIRSLKATYYRIALDFIDQYHNDALMNGLTLDRHTEEQAVEMFAGNIIKAGEAFMENPQEKPFIPSWNRVVSAIPDILEQLKEAVEADLDV
ncbi:MAG: glycosyl transferase [Lentisphaeraceae bacterium]|nr:glycosyl transferase [Lentisphaeraceae bacterium]